MGRVSAQKAANLISRGPRESPHFVNETKPSKRPKQGRAALHNSGFKSLGNARTTNAHHIGRRGDSDTDEDYAMVLNAGINHRDCSFAYVEEGGDGLDTDFAVQDPQHKLFSESVKVHGRSYALKWKKNDGTTYIMEYEDIINVDPLETCTVDKNMTAPDNSWKNISDGVQGRKISWVGKSTRTKPLAPVSGSKTKHNFTVPKSIPHVYDRHSRRVSNLRMDGKRVIHTSKTGEAERYRENESSSSDHFEREVIDRNVIATEYDDSYSIQPSNLRMYGKSILHTSKTGEVVGYEEDEASSSYPLEREVIDRNVIAIKDNDVRYSIFQSNYRMDGEIVVYTSKTGEVVRYAGDQESLSDSDIDVMDRDPREGQNRTPYPAMQSGTIGNRSDFKEKLFTLLQKPYSREEYDDLLQKASYRRKRKRKPNEPSRSRKHKSYLDKFPALRQEIDLVRHNHRKVLNLLRGFFYWLMNVPREEGFVPWLEPSCLEVLPEEADD